MKCKMLLSFFYEYYITIPYCIVYYIVKPFKIKLGKIRCIGNKIIYFIGNKFTNHCIFEN